MLVIGPSRRRPIRRRITELPSVRLQIVLFDAGPNAAAGGPFSILRFPEPDLPDVVCLEQWS